MFRLATLIDLY